MAKDRELTLKLNLKPGDVRALKQTFKSISDEAAKIKIQARQRAAHENLKDAVLGRAPPEVLAAKGEKGAGGAGGGLLGKASGLLKDMGLGGVGKALGSIAKMAGPAAAALGLAVGISKALIGMFKTITSFVQKANPGAVQRLGLAMDDLVAVIGHTLTPVVEVVTKAIRNFGDFLATILPSSQEFRAALAPVFEELDEFRDVLATIAPYIKDYLTQALKTLTVVLKLVYGTITQIIRGLKALGLVSSTAKLTSSMGAAARQHTFTNPEEYAKSIYLAAANAQGREPQKETADNTKGIWDTLKEIPERIGKAIGDTFRDMFVGFQGGFERFRDAVIAGWDSLKNTFEGLGTTIGETLAEGWEQLKTNLSDIFRPIGDKFGEVFASVSAAFDKVQNFATDLSRIPEDFQNVINDIPNRIKDGASQLADNIANAVRSVLPQLPGLPSLPGGGGGSGGGAVETATRAGRSWLGFGLL